MQTNPQTHELYSAVWRAAWVGLLVNLVLGITKLVGGIIGSSFALIADAVNSLGDVVTTVVVLFSLKIAQRPADDEHPYGHTRAEGIAALSVSLLIIVSALAIGWEAISKFRLQHAIPEWWTLVIAGVNVVIKEGLYRYKLAVGRKTGSMAIIANAWDHRSDAFCALAVWIGLAAIRLGGSKWMWADEAAALVVAAMIIWVALKLFRQSASELMDIQADPPLVESIRATAASVPGVAAVEKLWVRKSGLEFFADIHIQVDPQLTVEQGHRISHDVKSKLLQEYVPVRGVLVHLEPYQ